MLHEFFARIIKTAPNNSATGLKCGTSRNQTSRLDIVNQLLTFVYGTHCVPFVFYYGTHCVSLDSLCTTSLFI